ncbi:MAG: T9SS type A sorting domain-containing protein, partial [Ferruginibacter sp.]
QVEWKVDNQVNIASYEVEKSIDGRNFTKVNTTTASGVNGSAANYNWLDVQAVQGDNFYRIKSIGTTGAIQYSKVVKVTKGLIKSGIAIYPNPVTDGVVGLQLNNLSKGLYTVVITNAVGQRILTKAIQHDGGSATETLQTSSTLAKGMYQLTLIAQDKTQQVTSLLIK